jgi:AcrR family transcriptional regulator
MTNISEPVKRRYQSSLRSSQSRATKAAIVAAASRLFTERGYVATPFEAIAEAAGVGRATVFGYFPTKASLLKAAYEVALRGNDEPVALPDQPRSREIRADPDVHRFLAGYAEVISEMGARLAGLHEAVRAAATADPEVGPVWHRIQADRRMGAGNVVALAAAKAPLRPGLDLEAAADVIWILNDPGLFERLVRERGWSEAEFRRWLGAAFERELLP